MCHRPVDTSSCSQASCIRAGGTKESFICVPLQSQLKRKLEGINNYLDLLRVVSGKIPAGYIAVYTEGYTPSTFLDERDVRGS